MSRLSFLVPSAALPYAVATLLACAACSSKSEPPVVQPVEAGTGVAGTLPQPAGMASPAPLAGSAGSAGQQPVQPPATKQTFTSAQAQLDQVIQSADVVTATAVWRTTSKGVDLEVTTLNCAQGVSNPLEVLDAADCSPASLQAAKPLPGNRGRGIPSVNCIAGGVRRAQMAYSRGAKRQDAWTIGDGSATDLVGRVFVLRDPNGTIHSCGKIVRAPDVVRVPLPPATQAPSLESRGAIAGLCLARMFPSVGTNCPSTAGIVSCVEQHCDLGGCVESCAEYTRCLDRATDVCGFDTQCTQSAECATCQVNLNACLLGFCAEQVTCSPGITPDGPCSELSYCCAMQGDQASACIRVLGPAIASLGGDSSCIGSMNDWDVLSHQHVPCTFGQPGQVATPPVPAGSEGANAAPLADNKAGASCVSDMDCPGGHCEPVTGASASSGGYCTRACNTPNDCGESGQCVTLGRDPSTKRCLAGCADQSECRDGFVCTGGLQGTGIALSPSCRPKRAVNQLAADSAGKACSQDTECGGGYCAESNLLGTAYPGNYCTGRCYSDAECGGGGICLWPKTSLDPGYCLKRCTADKDCGREGYGCWTLGDGERLVQGCYPKAKALPDRTAGKACTGDSECGGTAGSCVSMLPFDLVSNDTIKAPGNYCSQRCALDAECGAGGQCINYGTHGGICLATCSATAPCRAGYACVDHQRDRDPEARVCVVKDPNATGLDAGI